MLPGGALTPGWDEDRDAGGNSGRDGIVTAVAVRAVATGSYDCGEEEEVVCLHAPCLSDLLILLQLFTVLVWDSTH